MYMVFTSQLILIQLPYSLSLMTFNLKTHYDNICANKLLQSTSNKHADYHRLTN